MPSDSERVLDFWIGEVGPAGWYKADEAVDRAIADRFGTLVDRAATGACDRWVAAPRRALALMILLDQFPRNLFRGTADAFASDQHCRGLARVALKQGHDLKTPEPERQFFYLPFMHSEFLQDQERAVRLICLRMPEGGDDNLDHGVKHRAVIRRFGRFPSRNAPLGRADSDAERAYRAEGGYMG